MNVGELISTVQNLALPTVEIEFDARKRELLIDLSKSKDHPRYLAFELDNDADETVKLVSKKGAFTELKDTRVNEQVDIEKVLAELRLIQISSRRVG